MQIEISTTAIFDKWFDNLKDTRTRTVIRANIARMQDGNLGEMRSVGQGVFEKKIHYAQDIDCIL
ncbi:hypothetical protein NO2_1273 [Candidatus Termititenax persephonae]|uniref:Addiction module killer protein n=1 Tax=Candidatus Termititenax persephonae TaxID=2218525 RepID=A0A388TIL2_9BACT|nr:hypothetical protein NO2_1273 [Candidatus Termititenax persephonae]